MAVSTAVPNSARARIVGLETIFVNLRGSNIVGLPQRIAVVGQGASASVYAVTKLQVTSAQQAGEVYGFGSPIHLAVRQLLPSNGDGVGTIPVTIYPLVDDGSGVVSTGDITPGGSPTKAGAFTVRINNIDSEPFVISVGDSVATIVTAMTTAINAVLEVPIIAVDGTTVVNFTSKWKGTSANEIVVEVIGPTDTGSTFAVTQPVGGLINPSIDAALLLVGDVWETMFLNCMESTDTTTLGDFDVFGEGRWGALVKMPMVAFVGDNVVDVNTAIVVPDARKTDRTNSQLVAPGSKDLPLVIAARQLARIALLAENNPPHDYGSLNATNLVPGADEDQWTFLERDVAIKAGSSSIQVKDGVVNLSDTITFFHPAGEVDPAFRYVVDIVKLQQIIFNLGLIFETPEWDGAPLIPDGQPTTNSTAKRPSSAIAAVNTLIDSLGLAAIISDPETAKTRTLAVINDQNPKRLDISMTVQLSGNVNIISIDLNFGFFFGTPEIVVV